jgi:hypothetical protein
MTRANAEAATESATAGRPPNTGRGATIGPWWRFLAEASESLDASLEYQETLTNVLRLAVPKIADYAIITVRANDGLLHWAGARHRDPTKASLVDRLQAYVPPDAAHRHWGATRRDHRPGGDDAGRGRLRAEHDGSAGRRLELT